MKPIIQVKNLYTAYGKHIIHNNISFEVEKGEIFAILGGSGSGKSTLLRSMILLNRPKAGKIEIFGEDIWSLKEDKKNMFLNRCGVLFQFGALYSSLNVLENVGIMLEEYSSYSKKEIQEVSKIWLEMVGLNKRVYQLYPYELSGGMKKRVGLARAMAIGPEILFLDEPTSGLDPASAGKFDELILKLKEMLNLTIVMITHDLDSIADTVDRFILLKDGQIDFDGNLKEFVFEARTEGLTEDNLFNSTRGERFWKEI
ncbi:ABC transporter ATP-binding protein [Helicobacter cappadocius]|uniref:ATP-binding cassette domain-containing protein n=1 Tax=Helicobacter cappadocius TaxID=3063998 RepID=A0AA90PTD1_9HELI|nr:MULTISPECIES: ATP-binding cassette domain-containing protein [unclassified Helicobacter]MDO7252523.1 ATP-binding cassette domain-containing protein [Helicobacter sp. faydin-H75]MDP2538390.1 ATP-binding cassette domain-containing protein [Helicobacter sp. faydin-H76]